jgi:hypothetical protein
LVFLAVLEFELKGIALARQEFQHLSQAFSFLSILMELIWSGTEDRDLW